MTRRSQANRQTRGFGQLEGTIWLAVTLCLAQAAPLHAQTASEDHEGALLAEIAAVTATGPARIAAIELLLDVRQRADLYMLHLAAVLQAAAENAAASDATVVRRRQ